MSQAPSIAAASNSQPKHNTVVDNRPSATHDETTTDSSMLEGTSRCNIKRHSGGAAFAGTAAQTGGHSDQLEAFWRGMFERPIQAKSPKIVRRGWASLPCVVATSGHSV
eukprot:m.455158 g.455158  ORF g.455158 m.455158 type:complete len:109 (-) comp20816_c0_seq1:256-582(-)